ncbi:PAS domain-containing hybrid sensor histidine kinase/response regulator [Mangrovibacter yixingensis]|uniref:PAS domain-containing hybrid sensor histidine kinase/response regulator n=1 Tax=Mangrovibacter yixingensis TaxID=1529639 RepID=UPI001CFB0967|nr:PAS domain S-box protein [Mangrovibacter yixingensis]
MLAQHITKLLHLQFATVATFLVGMLMAAGVALTVHQLNEEHIRQAMINSAQPEFSAVIASMSRYQYGLFEARTAVLSGGGEDIENSGFNAFAKTLDLKNNFPGARGFGFVRRVPHATLADFVEEERQETWPDFSVKYIAPWQGEHFIIEYLEPQNVSTNAKAIGLDIASEKQRREAATKAMKTGNAAITRPLALQYSNNISHNSFLILLPIYLNATTPETENERVSQCFGWAFAPLSIADIMRSQRFHDPNLILTLSDVTDPENPETFYRSSMENGAYTWHQDNHILSRTWRFSISTTPVWLAGLNLFSVSGTFFIGILFSAILALLVNIAVSRANDRRRLSVEQSKLTLIVESSADAIIGKDINGKIISWNTGAEKMFGYTREEAMGHYLSDLIIPMRLQNEEVMTLNRVRNKETISDMETVRRRKDGSELQVSGTVSPILNASGAVIGASTTVRDISQQKENEQRIQELNQNLEQQVRERTAELAGLNTLLSTVMSATYEFTIIATDLTGIIRLFNKGAERMLGYSEEEVVGKVTPVIIHVPEEVERYSQQLSAETHTSVRGFDVFVHHARQGLSEQREWTYVRKDGSRFPVRLVVTTMHNATGELTGYLGISMDITQQRQAQQALESARDQLLSTTQTLLTASKTAGLGIWRWNLADNSLEWNDLMYSFYDLPTSLEGNGLSLNHWESRIHPDDRELAIQQLRDAVDLNQEYTPAFRVVQRNGEIRYLQAGAYIERDHQGQAVRVTGINLDVTEDHVLRGNLIEAKEQADAANAAKSMFLANMSHEIRTPMNAVLGMLQLLLKTQLAPRQYDFAEKAHIAAKSLLGLLNDILDYSKIDAGKLELDNQPFNINKLMEHLAIVMSGNLNNKSIELLFDLDSQLPPDLTGDEMRLQQVLINLVSNAIKFTEQGEVVVTTLMLAMTSHSVTLKFSVSDTGIGINPDQLARIFDVFTQAEASTSRRYGGTGLGLVISRRLVESMGGELVVHSTEGKGSDFSFSLTLPRADGSNWQPLTFPQPAPKTLVVDDNPVARALLEYQLTTMNVPATSTNNPDEAIKLIALAAQEGNPFDVVLLDWIMPEMDGLALAEHIRYQMNLATIPTLILVSAANHADLPDTHNFPMLDNVLTKPLTPEQLFTAINLGRTHAEAITHPQQHRLAGVNILVVEDNPFNQMVISEFLTSEGANTRIASGGEEGVRAVLSGRKMFDIVLMDVQMPDIDGLEATRRIRANPHFANLPIIAMTANVSASDRQNCLDAGMNDHIGKPLDFNNVITTLSRMLGRTQTAFAPVPSNLPGFLQRTGGNAGMYQTLLNAFLPSFTSLQNELRSACLAKNWPAAMAVIHTMKGASGSAGLDKLWAWLVEQETALKVSDDNGKASLFAILPDEIEQRTQSEYAVLMAQITALIAEKENDGGPGSEPAQPITEIIQLLHRHLDNSNMEALGLAKSLCHTLAEQPGLTPELNQLVQATESLDFELAKHLLIKIQEQVHVE